VVLGRVHVGNAMERAQATVRVVQRFAVSVALLLTSTDAHAEGDSLAMEFRNYVVQIQADWPDGTSEYGSGFIVGEQDGTLFVATAYHVVRKIDSGEPAKPVHLKFFTVRGRFEATVAEESNPDIDLAVLEVQRPKAMPLLSDSLVAIAEPVRTMPVWYVDVVNEWEVPPPGIVSKVNVLKHEIKIRNLNVFVGASGAPLIGESGIVGMIIYDQERNISSALTIDAIRTAITDWRLPWQFGDRTVEVTSDLPEPFPFIVGKIELTGTERDFDEFTGAATSHSPTYVVGQSGLDHVRHYIGYSYGDPVGGNKAQFLQFDNLVVDKQYTFYVQPSAMNGDGNCFYATAESGAAIVEGGCRGWLANPVNRTQDAWKIVFVATSTSATIRLGNNWNRDNSGGVSRFIYIDAIYSGE
jgi:Trypsin-like peptidase domain